MLSAQPRWLSHVTAPDSNLSHVGLSHYAPLISCFSFHFNLERKNNFPFTGVGWNPGFDPSSWWPYRAIHCKTCKTCFVLHYILT